MESHDLRIFKVVSELQSISKAAEKLDYVQSNISQRIKSLEQELGVRLFNRNNRGVTLTGEGKRLLEYTEQILLLIDEAKSSVNPAKWKETLTIGAPQTISALRIPQLFSAFLKIHPAELTLRTNRSQHLQEMLAYGGLDGIWINGPYDNARFETVYCYDEQLVLISAEPDPLKAPLEQTLILNSDTSCVYRQKLLELCKASPPHNPAMMEFDSLESILQAVSGGLGISVIPADLAYSRKKAYPFQLTELPGTVRVDFLIKSGRTQPPALKKFIRFLQERKSGQEL